MCPCTYLDGHGFLFKRKVSSKQKTFSKKKLKLIGLIVDAEAAVLAEAGTAAVDQVKVAVVDEADVVEAAEAVDNVDEVDHVGKVQKKNFDKFKISRLIFSQ